MYKRILVLTGSILVALAVVVGLLWFTDESTNASPLAQTQAGPPNLVTYQGFLSNDSGDPVADGNYDLHFDLCASPACSWVVWVENHAGVPVQDGYFTVILGSVSSLSASTFDGPERWLRVSAKAPSESAYTNFAAQRVTSVPYAMNAGFGSSWNGSADNYGGLHVHNVMGDGVQGESDGSGNFAGIYGYSTYTATGVWGNSYNGYGGYFNSSNGHALAIDGPSLDTGLTSRQIATLRWYDAISMTQPFSVPMNTSIAEIAFDGDHLWVTGNRGASAYLIKVRASDGMSMSTYSLGGACSIPNGVAFDGLHLWVACGNGYVVQVRASDGSLVSVTNLTSVYSLKGVAFDGAYIWATQYDGDKVTRLLVSNPTISDTYNLPANSYPTYLAFDGDYMWLTLGSGNVVKMLASNPTINDTYTLDGSPWGIAFDGANMWVARGGAGLTCMRASDGAILRTITTINASGVAFDGGYIWVTNANDNTVSKVRACDGTVIGTYPTGVYPNSIAFDGSHIWVVNLSDNTISKH